MIIPTRLTSIGALYIQCYDPVSEADILPMAHGLKRGYIPGCDLSTPLIIDFSQLRGRPGSLAGARRLALRRSAMQEHAPAGPVACICRDMTDVARVRFYAVIAQLTGLRDEHDMCAETSVTRAIERFCARRGCTRDAAQATIREVHALQRSTLPDRSA